MADVINMIAVSMLTTAMHNLVARVPWMDQVEMNAPKMDSIDIEAPTMSDVVLAS